MNSEFEHMLILFHYDSEMDGTMLMENMDDAHGKTIFGNEGID